MCCAWCWAEKKILRRTFSLSGAATRSPDGVVGGGAAVGPQGLLPVRFLQRLMEQIIDEDGVALTVVDVLVICSDKFLQSSSLAWRCSSFSSSTEWQRRHFRGDSTGAVLGEGG